MKLSAPIYRLKQQAKVFSRTEKIPLHEALDQIAQKEGFSRWSLLTAQTTNTSAKDILSKLLSGDLMLVGARPGHGKTKFSLELVVEAMKLGHRGVFFTLEYNETDVLKLFKSIGENPLDYQDTFDLYVSDSINANYISSKLATVPSGSIVVIDYLQLLDQKRENPELLTQVRFLKSFAKSHDLKIIFISQIDRSFDSSADICPSFKDVRLPNPLDLSLFNKACFLNSGKLQMVAT